MGLIMTTYCKPADLLQCMKMLSIPTCKLIPLSDYYEISIEDGELSWFPDENGQKDNYFTMLAINNGRIATISVALNKEGCFDVMDVDIDLHENKSVDACRETLEWEYRAVEEHLFWLVEKLTKKDKENGLMECLYHLLELNRKNKEEALQFLGNHCLDLCG